VLLLLLQAERTEEDLLKATRDADWEVVHKAVDELGVRGTEASLDALCELAVNGPIRRIRRAAAQAVAHLGSEAGAASIAKRLRGETTAKAAEALEVIAHPSTAKALERVAKLKEGEGRVQAVRALGALGEAGRIGEFAELLSDVDVLVRAAAVDALVRTKDGAAIAPLRDALKGKVLPAVMERRCIEAIRRLMLALPDDEKRQFHGGLLSGSFGMARDAVIDARFARLLGALGQAEAPTGPVAEYERALVSAGLSHAGPEVRAASVAALARLRAVGACERVEALAKGDAVARVRFHAMRAAAALRPDAVQPLLLDRLAKDADGSVREEAAVLCGKRRFADAAEPLALALQDASWEVAVSAAVSLGKLRDPRGVEPLVAMLAHKDWRRRGGAAAGLGWIRQKAAMEPLIEMLRDKEVAVVATTLEFLRHISGKALSEKPKEWREWWALQGERFEFRDTEKEAKEAKRYGYAVSPREVYRDLDIVVLQTRKGGDSIETLLDDYEISYRLTRAASVDKAGLHPYALFVANCPGELVAKDVERIQWHVRAGGYLFASCWALTHTVAIAFPDIVRKLETRAQVIDNVAAEPRPSESPFTKGVFDGVTSPLYVLMGSHIIDVIDPERFEVLIDSPECVTKWGGGDMAGWCGIGHGVVLDSANHFDLQGMSQVRLSDETERMAFAMDHLGYTYEELRALRAKGIFAKQPAAVKGTRDQSIFRFITTFVREKRLADQE